MVKEPKVKTGQDYWDFVKKQAEIVDSWPDWKKGERMRMKRFTIELTGELEFCETIEAYESELPALVEALKLEARAHADIVNWQATIKELEEKVNDIR